MLHRDHSRGLQGDKHRSGDVEVETRDFSKLGVDPPLSWTIPPDVHQPRTDIVIEDTKNSVGEGKPICDNDDDAVEELSTSNLLLIG